MAVEKSKVSFPKFPIEMSLQKAISDQILFQTLKPEALLRDFFEPPAVQATPKEYLKFLENVCAYSEDLVQLIEEHTSNESIYIPDTETIYFIEIQIFILKKQEGLFKRIQKEIENFLKIDSKNQIQTNEKDLSSFSTDLSAFIAKYCPTLYDDLNYYSLKICRLKFCSVEENDPCYSLMAEEYKIYAEASDQFSALHKKVFNYLTAEQKSDCEEKFRETRRRKQNLKKYKPDASIGPSLIDGLKEDYQDFNNRGGR